MEQTGEKIRIPVVLSGPKKEREELAARLVELYIYAIPVERFDQCAEVDHPMAIHVMLKPAGSPDVLDDVQHMVHDCAEGRIVIRTYYGTRAELAQCAKTFRKALRTNDRHDLPPTVFAVMPIAAKVIQAQVTMLYAMMEAQAQCAARCAELWNLYLKPTPMLW